MIRSTAQQHLLTRLTRWILALIIVSIVSRPAQILHAQEQTPTTAQRLLGLWQNKGSEQEVLEFTPNFMWTFRYGKPVETWEYAAHNECTQNKGQQDLYGNFIWIDRHEKSGDETACWEILTLTDDELEFGLINDKHSAERLKARFGEHTLVAEAVRYRRVRDVRSQMPPADKKRK
jgi:hypothetical protein